MQELSGFPDASGLRIGIGLSRFNSRVSEGLLAGALEAVTDHGGDLERVTVCRVAGAWEVPQALRLMLRSNRPRGFDLLIALGAIVRGETPHFDYLARGVTAALESLAADSGVPLAYGILTCDTIEQALERSGSRAGNKGYEAACAAFELAQLRRQIQEG